MKHFSLALTILATAALLPVGVSAQQVDAVTFHTADGHALQITNGPEPLIRCDTTRDPKTLQYNVAEHCVIYSGHTLEDLVTTYLKERAERNANLEVLRAELATAEASIKDSAARVAACDAISAGSQATAQNQAELQGVIERQRRDIETLKQQLAASKR